MEEPGRDVFGAWRCGRAVREQFKDGPKSAAAIMAAAEAAEISEIALIAAACVRNRRQHRPLPRRRHDNY